MTEISTRTMTLPSGETEVLEIPLDAEGYTGLPADFDLLELRQKDRRVGPIVRVSMDGSSRMFKLATAAHEFGHWWTWTQLGRAPAVALERAVGENALA